MRACGIWRYALTCVAAMKPSPTMPTLMVCCEAILNRKFAHDLSSRLDVHDARISRLALNAAKSGESKFIKRVEEFLPIHFARANWDFLAPITVSLRAFRVFDMHLFQPLPERAQRIYRITAIVKNHVRRIEIHAHVRTIQLNQKQLQIVRVFLSGFERELETFAFEHIRDLANAADQFFELRIFVIVRQESGVKSHESDAQGFRDVRDLLDVVPI